MDLALLIGSSGVFLLLLAFMLNLAGKLSEKSIIYLIMNLTGAAMSTWYAWVSDLIPFVILEATWAAVSIIRLIILLKSDNLNETAV